jgi:hypothetical protein
MHIHMKQNCCYSDIVLSFSNDISLSFQVLIMLEFFSDSKKVDSWKQLCDINSAFFFVNLCLFEYFQTVREK